MKDNILDNPMITKDTSYNNIIKMGHNTICGLEDNHGYKDYHNDLNKRK